MTTLISSLNGNSIWRRFVIFTPGKCTLSDDRHIKEHIVGRYRQLHWRRSQISHNGFNEQHQKRLANGHGQFDRLPCHWSYLGILEPDPK